MNQPPARYTPLLLKSACDVLATQHRDSGSGASVLTGAKSKTKIYVVSDPRIQQEFDAVLAKAKITADRRLE
jgi:hypothetical protein